MIWGHDYSMQLLVNLVLLVVVLAIIFIGQYIKRKKQQNKDDINKRKWTAEEVQQWYRDTGAFTYANPDDLNIVVKKPRREGLTVNWANPKAYLLQGAILAVVFAVLYLLK